MSYGQQKPWSGMYMQQSTYQHDFSQGGYMQRSTYSHDYTKQGISPRNRPGNMPYNASMRADIPAGTYRPTAFERVDMGVRDIDGQKYDERGAQSERLMRVPKRGTEWIGGRRYDNEPRTDRFDAYERERRRDFSPERDPYERGRRDFSPERYGRYDDFDRQAPNRTPRDALDPYGFGRYTSIGQFDPYYRPYNGYNPRTYDRGRNGSPERGYNYERDRERNGYHDRFEKPRDPPVMDGYADRKVSDRTTYKDYGEFMQDKIKQDELRRNQLDYPTQNFPPTPFGGVYLFIRTNKEALVEVRKALQEARTVLANSGGQLKGIAHANQIKLLEGRPDGWIYRPSVDPGKEWDIENIVSVFWFPTIQRAERWLDYESKFKIRQFPYPDGADIFAAPINFIPREGDLYGTTFLMTEYREILDVDKFRELFVGPMRGIFKRLQIPDFVMNTVGVKSLRGSWATKRSIVTVNRFEDSESAERFFFDRHNGEKETELNGGMSDMYSSFVSDGFKIKLLEGNHGWNIRYPVIRRGEYWLERADSTPTLQDILVVFEFSDFSAAERWLMTESKFKISDYPQPHGSDIFVAPINYRPTYDQIGRTFIMTEYPQAMADLIKEKYGPRMRKVLLKFYQYDDQLTIQCVGIKWLRGSWIKPNSVVIGISFREEVDAMDYWRDPEIREIRDEISQLVERSQYRHSEQWFQPTTVMFTLYETRV